MACGIEIKKVDAHDVDFKLNTEGKIPPCRVQVTRDAQLGRFAAGISESKCPCSRFCRVDRFGDGSFDLPRGDITLSIYFRGGLCGVFADTQLKKEDLAAGLVISQK